MTMTTKLSLFVAATLAVAVLAAPAAHADTRSEVEYELKQDMYRLAMSQWEVLQEHGSCRKTLALAKKKLKATDKLTSSDFGKHPSAVQDGDQWTITVADIPWICDAIDQLIARASLVKWLGYAEGYEKTLATNPPLKDDPNVRIHDGDYYVGLAKTCAEAVAKEVAAGTTSIDFQGKAFAIADAERLCPVLGKWGEYMNASGLASFEKVAPKYRDLGVAGDRLELFVQYDNLYFYGKGCVIIDDIKKLVKAKKVFQWLENSDYTHTIRTYTFKGNKYKISEKTYATEAKAYKGCK